MLKIYTDTVAHCQIESRYVQAFECVTYSKAAYQ